MRSTLTVHLAIAGLFAPPAASQATYTPDPDVSLAWERTLQEELPARDSTRDVAVSPGRLLVLQESRPSDNDVAVVHAHDAATGERLWTSVYAGPPTIHLLDPLFLVAAPDGSRVFAVVKERLFVDPLVGLIPRNFTVVAFDGVTGAILWERAFEVLEPLEPTPHAATISADGAHVYVGGKLASIVPLFKTETLRDGFVVSLSASDGSTAWSSGYDGPEGLFDSVEALAVDPVADRVYATLSVQFASTGLDFLTRALDGTTGELLWESFHRSAEDAIDEPRAVASDGSSVFVGGSTGTAPPLIAYDAVNGTELWTDPFEDLAVDELSVSPGGESLAVLHASGAARLESMPLVPGAPEWATELVLNPAATASSPGMGFTEDGAHLAVGLRQGQLHAFSVEAASGVEAWSTLVESDFQFPFFGETRLRAAGGRIFAARDVETEEGFRVAVDAYGAVNGTLDWTVVEDGPKPIETFDLPFLALAPDGSRAWITTREAEVDGPEFEYGTGVRELDLETGESIWATVDASSATNSARGLVAGPGPERVTLLRSAFRATAVDADSGSLLWEASWGGLDEFGSLSDAATAGVVAPDESVLYAAGYTVASGESGRRMGTVAWSATDGSVLWGQTFTDVLSSVTTANDIATSPDGTRVFVAGTTWNGADSDLAAIAYDATSGAELWSLVLPGASDEGGSSLVPSPDGARVYVAGTVFSALEGRAVLGAVALDAGTGALLWTDDAGSIPSQGSGELLSVGSSLSIDGSRLYHAGHAPLDIGRLALRVAAVDTSSGARRWTYAETAGEGLEAVKFTPTPDGRSLHVLAETRSTAHVEGNDVVRLLALDAATGQRLWRIDREGELADATDLGVGPGFSLVVGESVPVGPHTAGMILRFDPAALQAAPDGLSLADGGAQRLQVTASSEQAGQRYWVLGSASGTEPGLAAGGQVLPLVFDDYLLLSLTFPNAPPFLGTLGVLDSDGKALAEIDLPAGLDPSLAGIDLHHAFVVLGTGSSIELISNPSPLLLLP